MTEADIKTALTALGCVWGILGFLRTFVLQHQIRELQEHIGLRPRRPR